MESERDMVIGVISDTHAVLRPEVLTAIRAAGVDVILHAGDVGSKDVLDSLTTCAPVHAVRGNMDCSDWAVSLPATRMLELGGAGFYILHDLHTLDLDPAAAGVRVVVHGHTHRASSREQRGVLYFNPGSAGPRRHNRPVSIGIIRVVSREIFAEVLEVACLD